MKFFDKLFAEGNRKTLMSLIALIITVVTEKYTGPLSGQALEAIVAIIAIFAGGNVAEHFANALKMKYDRGPIAVDAPQQYEQAPDPVPQQPSGPTVDQVANYAQKIAKDATDRFAAIEGILTKQANSIQGLVNALNTRPVNPQNVQRMQENGYE